MGVAAGVAAAAGAVGETAAGASAGLLHAPLASKTKIPKITKTTTNGTTVFAFNGISSS
jgi:hypothetical protein